MHNEPQIKTRVAEFSEQAQPDWHPHFHAARAGDIAQIDDIDAFPAEPFAEPTRGFALRGFAIAADEQIVITRHDRWIYHERTIYGVQHFHDERIGEFPLDLFTQGISVTNR